MFKTFLIDTDGMIINREMYFSERFSKEFSTPLEKLLPFFKNEFQLCLSGTADLKEELNKYIRTWRWKKSIDELLNYWFKSESSINSELLDSVDFLRTKGHRCYLHTNNEKYRVKYIMENLGLQKHFDGIFASSELLCKKPDIIFWLKIIDRLGITDGSEIIVWDDDRENVDSAIKAGLRAENYTDFNDFKKKIKPYLF